MKTINKAKKWIPCLVQAMKDSGIYGARLPRNIAHIIDDINIRRIEATIKSEQKIMTLKNKWAVLEPRSIYELRTLSNIVVLVLIVKHNNNSIKVTLLASNVDWVDDFIFIEYRRRTINWRYAPFGLEDVSSYKKVSIQELLLYLGMNNTTYFEQLLKEEG